MITVQPNSMTDIKLVREEIFRVLGRKLRFDPSDKEALHTWDFVTNIKEMNKVGEIPCYPFK